MGACIEGWLIKLGECGTDSSVLGVGNAGFWVLHFAGDLC